MVCLRNPRSHTTGKILTSEIFFLDIDKLYVNITGLTQYLNVIL